MAELLWKPFYYKLHLKMEVAAAAAQNLTEFAFKPSQNRVLRDQPFSMCINGRLSAFHSAFLFFPGIHGNGL